MPFFMHAFASYLMERTFLLQQTTSSICVAQRASLGLKDVMVAVECRRA